MVYEPEWRVYIRAPPLLLLSFLVWLHSGLVICKLELRIDHLRVGIEVILKGISSPVTVITGVSSFRVGFLRAGF